MKLCWLIPDDHGGGVVSVALSCVRQAQIAGHKATLLLFRPLSGWLEPCPDASWTLASLNQTPPDTNSTTAIQRWLELHPQDILVINACGEADAAISYLPAGLRLIYAVHDTAARYWEAALRYESELDAIVAVSEVVADCLRSRMREPHKLLVVHNGSFFPPSPSLLDRRPQDLLFLCGDNPTKGAYDLLSLWRQLVKDGFAGELHWFGQMEADFTRRVQALPKSSRIHLLGRAPRAEVFAAAARCKVFLMLSRVEPFGMVTIEAMSMGAIPVAWDIATGTREIVRSEESGLFAPLGDFVTLSAMVKRAVDDKGQLAATAMQQARERFSEKKMWENYAALIAKMMDQTQMLRPLAGQTAPPYQPPWRYFQLLPKSVRQAIRSWIGASPRLGYWLRDHRGL